MQPAEHARQARTLADLLSELERVPDPDDQLEHELASLGDQLAGLAPDRRALVEAAVAPINPAVAWILERADDAELRAELRRDLRRVLRRIRAVIEHVAASPAPTPAERARLEVSYADLDLAALARTACAAFERLAASRDLTFQVELPATLVAPIDGGKLELVLLNLLFNAFKYTPPGGTIRCRLSRVPWTDEVVLVVSDDGPGVPASQGEAIFEHVRQLDRSVFLPLDGLGFSLALCRTFVALHGGTLVLRQGPRGGCVFRAALPARAPHGLAIGTEPWRPGDLAPRVAATAARELEDEAQLGMSTAAPDDRPLVLIVEDSRAFHRILTASLGIDYRTASAFDGVEGLARATELVPDLVITDIGLPHLDGEAMIREIRSRPALERIPILVITAAEDPRLAVRLLERGAEDVLRKPLLLAELRARVARLLDAKRARDILSDAIGRHEHDLGRLAEQVAEHQHRLRVALEESSLAREIVENASRIKSNFLRMMSHELKTPITAILLHVRLLEREPAGASLHEGLGRISRSSRRLLHLVDTILEWARAESGRCRISLEDLEPAQIVAEVAAELATFAADKQLELVIADAPPAQIRSDRRLLRLITIDLLTHVIQNAAGRTISVTFDRDDHAHRIRIHSDAIASPEDRDAPQPFQLPFHPATDLRWSAGSGSGLGLSVVRDLARAIDGELVVEDRPGLGATYLLALPIQL